MKKILVLTAALLALGAVTSVAVPSFAQDTTAASNGEAVSASGQQSTDAAKSEGGGGSATDCSAMSSMSSMASDMSSMATDCPSSAMAPMASSSSAM